MTKEVTLFVLGLIVGAALAFNSSRSEDPLPDDSLTSTIDSLRNCIFIKDSAILSYQAKVDSLAGEVLIIDKAYDQLKSDYEEEINSVDTLSNSELISYLTNRYANSQTNR